MRTVSNMSINWEVILWTCITLAVIMGIIATVIAIVSARSLKSRRQQMESVHTTLKVGSKVMFSGGIYGTVVKAGEETLDVKIGGTTIITISRYAVQSVEN